MDPTTRVKKLPGGQKILLTDTVGFIRKLPHHLVEAFKSTLEEARYADILIHVADVSSQQLDEQMHVVYETLRELEALDKPVITAFNKIDVAQYEYTPRDFQADRTVLISAKTGEGTEMLLEAVEDCLREQKIEIEKIYSYSEAAKIQIIRQYGELALEEYREEGIYVKAYVPAFVYGRIC